MVLPIRFFCFLGITLACSLYAHDPIYTPVIPNLPEIVEVNPTIESEVNKLDILINVTHTRLEKQRQIRTKLLEYKKIQDKLLINDRDNELMFQMVKSAYYLLEMIKEEHLVHQFNSEFINELTLISQIGAKKGIPKP